MKKILCALSVCSALLVPVAAHSAQEAEQLGACMTDALSGKERKDLAKWIFFSMSTHSSIKNYTNVPDNDIDTSNKQIGGLISRLLTGDCPEIARAAMQAQGSKAFEYAFGVVGQVAMQELMTEKSVSEALSQYEKHLDHEKLNQIFN